VDEVARHMGKHGLVVHAPPNPRASFWFPTSTLFIAITRPDFGPVQWLGEQLDFPDLTEMEICAMHERATA
jgi:hypothetical protein